METQALAVCLCEVADKLLTCWQQISESDDLLSAAESQDSEDPIEALERAAKVLEEKQDVKIRKAAAKVLAIMHLKIFDLKVLLQLSRLEQERKMVKKAASKLLSEAQSKVRDERWQ